jgi:hypothetical protein
MKKSILSYLTFTFLIILSSCAGKGSEHLTAGYDSWKDVIKDFRRLAVIKKLDSSRKLLLTKTEFEKAVFIHLPEAKQKNPMPVEEYWSMSTYKRTRAIEYFIHDFREAKKIKLVKIGKPKKVKEFGPVTLYNKVPVSFSDDEGSVKTYEDLFSSIVCVKTGLFSRNCKLWSAGVED